MKNRIKKTKKKFNGGNLKTICRVLHDSKQKDAATHTNGGY